MMTLKEPIEETFLALLEKLVAISKDDPLYNVRARAWDHFLELGLPGRKSEVFRYLPMKKLFSKSLESPEKVEVDPFKFVYPECKKSYLSFVNGSFDPDRSNTSALSDKIVITPLNKATRTYGAFLNNQWAKSLMEEVDPFATLNAALHQNGIFIYVPPNLQIETPIQILHVIQTEKHSFMMPRIHLFVGKNSEINLLTTQNHVDGSGYFVNQVSETVLDEGASVTFTQLTNDIPSDSWVFDAFRAQLKRDSKVKTVSVTEGSESVRNDYRVALTGENGEALLNGVWMLSEKREAHAHVLMDHQAPHCRSLQLYKGVLNDVSHSSFEGKIYVHQEAQKTDAFQLNNNLLLSDHARADSKPNLEIFADDVKASHGATVGQLDKEQLFYMKTRGFSENEAKNLLVQAYCNEVIELIKIPSVAHQLQKRINERSFPIS